MNAVVKGCPIYRYTLSGRLVYSGVWLWDYKGIVSWKKVLLLKCRPLKLGNDLRVRKMVTRTVLRVRTS